MSKQDIQKWLTTGLTSNFSGKLKVQVVHRVNFQLNAVHSYLDGISYHDEWIGERMGGGQEIVKIGDEIFTRLYAGGAVDDGQLKQLGITHEEVRTFLTDSLLDLQDKTRLFENCKPKPVEDWQYLYKIVDNGESSAVTIGKETITYKGQHVFTHTFMLCAVK
jgi:hypothetical protein